MWLCAVETSSTLGEITLMNPDGECITHVFTETLTHARDFFPGLQTLLKRCGITRQDIGGFAVNNGPGSYTGIRIGVTAAKMLAYALDKPVVPVNGLKVLLANLPEGAAPVAAPVLDAKLNQVYASVQRFSSKSMLLENFVGSVSDLAGKLPPETMVFGDGAIRYQDQLAGFAMGPEVWGRPQAAVVARLARPVFLAGQGLAAEALMPLYLRVSEAERKLAEKKRAERKRHEKKG